MQSVLTAALSLRHDRRMKIRSRGALMVSGAIPKALPQMARALDLHNCFLLVQENLVEIGIRIREEARQFDPAIVGYVEYVCENHGKGIRPALALLTAHATGNMKEAHRDMATIVELIHLATLVHDDILDGAHKRRKKMTAYAKWGSEISVLLGDCLFSRALLLCTQLPGTEASRRIAAAAHEVCTGEILQTQRRFDLSLSVAEYLRIVGMKTGALFRISTELAGLLSQSSDDAVKALGRYGDALGVAYQIYDDCLDLVGAEDAAGKTLGTDIARGKLTLPVLYALEDLQGKERDQLSEMILHGTAADRKQLLATLLERGYVSRAVQNLQNCLRKSIPLLDCLPSNDYRTALQTIPEKLIEHVASLAS